MKVEKENMCTNKPKWNHKDWKKCNISQKWEKNKTTKKNINITQMMVVKHWVKRLCRYRWIGETNMQVKD